MCVPRTVRLMFTALTCLLLWAGVLCLLPSSRAVHANPGSLFVTVAGTGTVCSRAQPCGLQTALVQSVDGDCVYVAAGTYIGSGAAVVTLTKSIALYGGWDGAAGGAVLLDPDRFRSILDGEDLRRVICITGTITSTVDGFTIQHGNATAAPDPGRGGGIYSQGANILIAHNVITANTAYTGNAAWGWGGGVYVYSAWKCAIWANDWWACVIITGNQVLSNVASAAGYGTGGGIMLYASPGAQVANNVVLSNVASSGVADMRGGLGGGVSIAQSASSVVAGNRIEHNWAMNGTSNTESRGGGLYCELGGGYRIESNVIRYNVASSSKTGTGGGIDANQATGLVVARNTIESNTACTNPAGTGQGGGLSALGSRDVVIEANRFLSNTASLGPIGEGGAVYMRENTSFTMTNNVVARNHAWSAGGGLAFGAAAATPVTGTLLHNTFVDNHAGSGDGRIAIHLNTSPVRLTLTNNLIAGHSHGVFAVAGSTATLTSTLFFGQGVAPTGGAGSIVNTGAITGQDPLLDVAYHLRAGSLAIDRGVNAGVITDIDGDARPIGAGYDIGADEYAGPWRLYLPVVVRGVSGET
jgi:fibronectin-binding autotransporter adhesin